MTRIDVVTELLWETLTALGVVVSKKEGDLTLSATVVEAVSWPAVPVIVRLVSVSGAPLAAATVRTELPEAGLVPHEAKPDLVLDDRRNSRNTSAGGAASPIL